LLKTTLDLDRLSGLQKTHRQMPAPTGATEMTAKTYLVTVEHNGETLPLRGTIWEFSMERAQHFASEAAAQAALDKAKKFMRPALRRKARIVEAG
jgi:hypothetical protein